MAWNTEKDLKTSVVKKEGLLGEKTLRVKKRGGIKASIPLEQKA